MNVKKMTTIKLAKTVPEKPLWTEHTRQGALVKQILKERGTERFSTFGESKICTSFDNGFVAAAFHAYSNHHHLVLRPDDVWLAVTRNFADYVNAHAETMRHLFVSHEGKKDLEVVSVIENWHTITQEFAQKLPSHVRSWLMPSTD